MKILFSLVSSALLLACVQAQSAIDPLNSKNLRGVPVVETEYLGDTVTLNCNLRTSGDDNGNDTYPEGSTPKQWLLPRRPNGFIPVVPNGRTGDTANVILNVAVSSDGWDLTVTRVTQENLGTYHCMMETPPGYEEEWYLVRIGLNTRGPYFIDQWDEWYKYNTLKGFFGFFFSLAVISTTAVVWGMYTEKKKGGIGGQKNIDEIIKFSEATIGIPTVAGTLEEKAGVDNEAFEKNTAL